MAEYLLLQELKRECIRRADRGKLQAVYYLVMEEYGDYFTDFKQIDALVERFCKEEGLEGCLHFCGLDRYTKCKGAMYYVGTDWSPPGTYPETIRLYNFYSH